jgi:hypothetical protein
MRGRLFNGPDPIRRRDRYALVNKVLATSNISTDTFGSPKVFPNVLSLEGRSRTPTTVRPKVVCDPGENDPGLYGCEFSFPGLLEETRKHKRS